jgi:hypothetical protein
MATKVVRAKAILDALADAPVTNALAARVGEAFAYTYARNEQNLTNEQEAGIFLLQVRGFIKQIVRDAEVSVAIVPVADTAKTNADIPLGTDGALVQGQVVLPHETAEEKVEAPQPKSWRQQWWDNLSGKS